MRALQKPLRTTVNTQRLLAISCTLISQLSARASDVAAPIRPPNPITLGERVKGRSDSITRGRVDAPMTCCFELVMMLMFSIWRCDCVCVSRSAEPVRRLSCTPELMAGGERAVKSQSSTIMLPEGKPLHAATSIFLSKSSYQTSASRVGCALSTLSQADAHSCSIIPTTRLLI